MREIKTINSCKNKFQGRFITALVMFILAPALHPANLFAQAGSAPAVSYQYSSLAGITGYSESGGRLLTQQPQRPAGVLKLAEDERYLIWVELSRGRLNVMELQDDGGLLTRKSIPISIGKNGFGKEREGDKLTPVGVYRLTSFLADNTLDDFYGRGAYPLNYPNAQDRLQKRTGHGIWLHGLPKDTQQRPLLDSDGCVVVDNNSLLDLAAYIQTGATYIVLSENDIEWSTMESLQKKEAALSDAFEAWRQSWEAIDNAAYLAHYADEFSDLSRDKHEWSRYKSGVNNAKSFITVATSKTSFIADPRDPSAVTVRFYQQYRSSNHDWDGWKEQLWQETAQGWKIVYEGNG